jgi:hypothetical protein
MKNIIRGFLTFLVICAIFTVVECRKESNENTTTSGQTSTTTATTGAASVRPATVTCTGAPSDAQLCDDPCTIYVGTSKEGDVVERPPDTVWVWSGSKVNWVGREPSNSASTTATFALDTVYFEKNPLSKQKVAKKGDHLLGDPQNVDGVWLKSTMSDASRCVAYAYTVELTRHQKKSKVDPDVEVGSTTPPFQKHRHGGQNEPTGTH